MVEHATDAKSGRAPSGSDESEAKH
jgi:hypothetical protein